MSDAHADRGELRRRARAACRELRSVGDMVRWGASEFNRAALSFTHGYDSALDEALALVLNTLHLSPGLASELFSARLTKKERKRIIARVRRRICERRPLAYLLGEAWFAGLRFNVDERVLVPRSPLAEWIEKSFEPFINPSDVSRIADLGTGSGCIAIACAHYFPDAQVDAVDVSRDALEVAAANVDAHDMNERVRLLHGDLMAPLQGQYDLIISNPPYVPVGRMSVLAPEFAHEPEMALASGALGIDHVSRIIEQATRYLSPHGVLVVEVGEAARALSAAFPGLPLTWLEFERGGDGVFLIECHALAR